MFHEQGRFVHSINSKFLVLIPKKRGKRFEGFQAYEIDENPLKNNCQGLGRQTQKSD